MKYLKHDNRINIQNAMRLLISHFEWCHVIGKGDTESLEWRDTIYLPLDKMATFSQMIFSEAF